MVTPFTFLREINKLKVFDFVVVGAGVVGLAIARELVLRDRSLKVAVLEKEAGVAQHASGRNSGVLHAGFYYSPDSLKAKLTVNGNAELKRYFLDKKIPFVQCGKVVVARSSDQVELIHDLKRRGDANGVELELVSEDQLSEIEPMAETLETALWSPNTAVGSPELLASAMWRECLEFGVQFLFDSKVSKIESGKAHLQSGDQIKFKHLINASGLYADRLAHQQGFGERYTMMPFIGLYHYAPALKGSLKRHIYPTPDPRNPFLGVHFTRTLDGSVKVGPTAIPLLSREQYSIFEGFNFGELFEILKSYPKFMTSGHHDVWSLVRTELPKVSRKYLLSQAGKLSSKVDLSKFTVTGKPGIRAQLFDKQLGKLEMDFVIEGDSHSTHVLNAVSPGWTTCLTFASYVVDDIESRQSA